MKHSTFQLHIDPAMYDYKWNGAQYATIHIMSTGDQVAVDRIEADFNVLGMIAVAGKWPEFNQEVNAAARCRHSSKGSPIYPLTSDWEKVIEIF